MRTTFIQLFPLALLLAGVLLVTTALWRPLLNLGKALLAVTVAWVDHALAKVKLRLVQLTLKLFPGRR